MFYFRFCSFIFNQPYSSSIYLFGFFSTLLIYNVFRAYSDLKQLSKSIFTERGFLILLSACLSSVTFFQLNCSLQVGYGIVGLLTFAYKFELIKSLNLRTIPYLKLPIIVIVWVISGSLNGILHLSEGVFNLRLFEFLGIQFLYFTSITIPFDVYGLIEDNFVTIPSKLGVSKALFLSKITLVSSGILGLFFYDSIALKMAHLIVFALTFGVIHQTESLQKKWIQYLLLDGCIILQTCIFLLFAQLATH